MNIEQEFLRQLYDNQNIVHKICRIYTNNQYDHEDLFQEIVIQLWKAYPKFRGDAKFTTWAYRIALNTAITLFKKNNKQPKIDKNKELFNLNIQAEYNNDEIKKIQTMYDAIYQLNDIEKALIMLFLEDKSYKEIAEIMGISEGNARIKMMRTKDKLKKLISKNNK